MRLAQIQVRHATADAATDVPHSNFKMRVPSAGREVVHLRPAVARHKLWIRHVRQQTLEARGLAISVRGRPRRPKVKILFLCFKNLSGPEAAGPLREGPKPSRPRRGVAELHDAPELGPM